MKISKWIASAVLLTFVSATVHVPLSYAQLDQTTSGNINTSALQPAMNLDCRSFCDEITAPVDDQWCANHGQQTSVAVAPKTDGLVRVTALPCNVVVFKGESCSENNTRIRNCAFKNSIVETQCLTYKAAKDANPFERTQVALNTATAVVCGVACAAMNTVVGAGYGAAMANVCNIMGFSASALEIVDILTMKSSKVNKSIDGLMAAAGGLNAASQASFALSKSGWEGVNGSGQAAKSKGQGKYACAMAVLYAIMAGMRNKSVSEQDHSKDEACEQVKSMASSAFSGITAQATTTTSVPLSVNAPVTSLKSSSSKALGASQVSSQFAGSSTQIASSLSCIQSSGVEACGNQSGYQSAAMDSGILTPESEKEIAKYAMDMGLNKMLEQGKAPWDAIQTAMGPALPEGSSWLSSGLADVSKAAYEDAKLLANAVPNSGIGRNLTDSGAYSSGGKAKAGASASAPTFGGFGSLGPATQNKADNLQFKKQQKQDISELPNDDIYHAGWKGSIFDIVSQRVSKTKDRVDEAEWTSPLNRAIMGLSNKPKK